MLAYHYTITYSDYTALTNDYHHKYSTAEPYLLALAHGKAVFSAMLLLSIYKDRVLRAETKDGWFEYAKDATEAIFEFVRQSEFSEHTVSRLNCVYYVRAYEDAQRLGNEDWENDSALKILEVELDETKTVVYDQSFYNFAYDRITKYRTENDLLFAMDCARKYFSRETSEDPVFELLSDGENRIVNVYNVNSTE